MTESQILDVGLDYCSYRPWVCSQAEKIITSVQQANEVGRKRKRGNVCKEYQRIKKPKPNPSPSVKMRDAVHHDAPDSIDPLLEFTTLLDPEEDPEERQSHVIACETRVAYPEDILASPTSLGHPKERSASVDDISSTDAQGGPSSLPQEIPMQPTPSHTGVKTQCHSPTTDELRHLIDPEILALEDAANIARSRLLAQRAAIAELVAQDRQLDAFEKALAFASHNVSACSGALRFAAKLGRWTYQPGVTYPVIAFILEDWWPNAQTQSRLAYELLSSMLECYGNLPFPDRVDVRELGFGCSCLVAQYGFDAESPMGYGGCEMGRVRKRIIEQMYLRGT
ncbi:hypothetical protein GGR51DRAFT_543352 [Nemania sp. FL0031]|nr:hypothetical protein GGR51DRAFT_543352 [Nemania sp. FL0031]